MSDSQPLDLSLGPRRVIDSHYRVEQRLVAPSNAQIPPLRPIPPRDINIASSSSHSISSSYDNSWAENYRARERDRQRQRRLNESAVRRDARRTANRELRAEIRARETPAERAARLGRQRAAVSRAPEVRRAAELAGNRRRARARTVDLTDSAFNYNPSFDYASHRSLLIGPMDNICTHCNARRFKTEAKGICCKDGKVNCDLFRPPPEPFLSYFSGDFPASISFLNHIRKYNSCFQMTSFGAAGPGGRDGVEHNQWSTFRIQGQVYHKIGSLMPMPDQEARFLQIYFMDSSDAQADRRCNLFRDCDRAVVLAFQRFLQENNTLIRSFKTALDLMPQSDLPLAIRAERTPEGEHERRFNAPVADEIAAILVQGEINERDIRLHHRQQGLQRINESHPKYDSLQYPLLHPYGEDGWHYFMKEVHPQSKEDTVKRLSPRSYYAYRLMIRSDDFVLKCRSLLKQYVVDMYAKIEAQRLLWARLNQNTLRVEEYRELRDAIANDADPNAVGRIILPATFTGSPRHMHEYAQDALAYVRLHGRADFFITFTCNPQWKEITELLPSAMKSNDREDIISRVFRQKVIKLKDSITKHNLFGPVKCYMYSIEWQKRGLPHAHMLIWLGTRIRPEQVDSVISAELPDPEQDPVLFETIKTNMIHGPCGLGSNSPCMKDRKCSKRYPKPFVTETQSAEDGYPIYRRRSPEQGGRSFEKQGFTIDNRWVVPYSPTLSKMFNAHINVEACHSVKSIKYICKYINKGSDMAVFEVGGDQQVDEITAYQTGRYISSSEAFWRIFEFPIHERYPAIQHLSIHLEDGQRVIYNPQQVGQLREPRTTLTEFFKLCRTDEFAQTIIYTDTPRFFRWFTDSKGWQRRKQGKDVPGYPGVKEGDTIGRLYTVSPKQRECFYLRILLINVCGPTSFEYLRTFDGVVYPTYHMACLKRGLLESDTHWVSTLSEAASIKMPSQLRTLFAVVLTQCETSDALSLWEQFKNDLSEDILLQLRRENPDLELNFTEAIYNEALILLEDLCLAMSNNQLVDFGLPTPDRSAPSVANNFILRETSYDLSELSDFVSNNRPKLTDDQAVAFNSIDNAIQGDTGGLFFLDAPGGTGKTFVINLLLAQVRERGDIILATASSGIAATLMAGGRTAHSTFNLPLDVQNYTGERSLIKKNSPKAQMLQICKCIVWDECTMAHKNSLWALDITLRDIRDRDVPFGGVVVVLSGDFRQTLPVIPRSTPADELNACLKQSYLWPTVQTFSLKTNMRVHLRNEEGAADFAQRLLSIGDGTCQPDARGLLPLTNELCRTVPNRDELINKVFPDLQTNLVDRTWQCERAILAPLNEMVDELNLAIQSKITNRLSRFYNSFDTTVDERQSVNWPLEFLNSQCPPGFPPHQLELKIGSTIMILRNLNPPRLCNGTRLRVKRMENNLILATILAGTYKGEDVFIPRLPLKSTQELFEFKRVQFPIKLAFAMTVNKSQGQTLGVVGIDLSIPCFSHGQLYVACSRVGSPSNMFVLAPENRTNNVVYLQALR